MRKVVEKPWSLSGSLGIPFDRLNVSLMNTDYSPNSLASLSYNLFVVSINIHSYL